MLTICGFGAAVQRQPRHRSATQVVEGHIYDAGLVAALPHDARNPSGVHGLPSEFSRMIGLRLFFAASSSAALSGTPTGTCTRTPVLDWRRRMFSPS